MSTPYHSQYWAHALTLKGPAGSMESLSRSIANARVDLNPHQVDAALFAVRSPLSKGVILADEVGLGKTIEAGIVIAQRWAERRRRILLIVPATLRKQWQQELAEKFALPSVILEGASFNAARKAGVLRPLDQPGQLIICSYHFAAAKAVEFAQVPWDLVVIDEAHRLRNVYKTSSRMAAAVAEATSGAPKLLLTATPLQNSLLELYGLVSVIDPHVFGNVASFREQFMRGALDEQERNRQLQRRLEPLLTRTLRKQVLEYIRFTQRVPLTQEFVPSDDEHRLYELVSAYLQREHLAALPASQRTLMTLVLRKLLASSTFAIAGTLRKLVGRLESIERMRATAGRRSAAAPDAALVLDDDDFDVLDELADEWTEDGADARASASSAAPDPTISPNADVSAALAAEELAELRHFAELAEAIRNNTKGEALLRVLETAFAQTAALGAARKAVIFTESRRTQQYLLELLTAHGYEGELVLMNGTNADPSSRSTYAGWLDRHAGTGLASGSRSADTKAAIVEEFRERGTILIATESAAEGVNLQFCSLVVNYDLPWNPQRIEQRIGRCHRYGQQHDVVVVNFLNKRNAADQRVYELLAQKFRLFDGVFGASDEVLGALESGVDIERRIAQVYQQCRTSEEIQAAFDALQREVDDKIAARMTETRQALLDNFDEEVHVRLKVHRDQALAALSERQQWLLALTRQELNGDAQFEHDQPRFQYRGSAATSGRYHLDWREAERLGDIFYRPDHELAQHLIERAVSRDLDTAAVTFDYSAHGAMVRVLEPLVGRSGWLELSRLTVSSFDTEEFLVLAGETDAGEPLDDELCRKVLSLRGRIADDGAGTTAPGSLASRHERRISELLGEVNARNAHYFDEEAAKLERWADDLRSGLERELKDLDRQISEARRASLATAALADKLAAQKALKSLEATRAQRRRDLYDAQDAIGARRDEMIAGIERQLEQRNTLQQIFTIRWTIT
ncbi:MAG: DEAD/DEAH box helicase [Gemmatimonadota bacterium]|nr:DEAD/DEAH box helicase [Gemmatimonadota bacterium]